MRNLYQTLLLITSLSFSTITYSQVPLHNSLPTATATIFLDFDGQLVENTSWNWSGPLTLNPSGLNSTQITEVFNRVSEDYRPFNINITTDSTKYWAAPINKRTRVIITTSSSWYGSAGGVAYVNSFTWGDNTPAFVFSALLGYNAKYVAEAASHEAGHTLGLRHQSAYDQMCNKTAEYNAGTGSGEIAWAPIMGVGYYRNFTLWNNGANPYGCTSYQDDLSIITSSDNGFGYRADDHSNNAGGSATAAYFANNMFTVNGIIEKISDKDHFKFTMPVNGVFHLNALPYNVGSGNTGSNLDVQVTLMSGPNTVIGVYNPQSSLGAVVDTVLNAGNYFIKVEGKGNVYAPEYASLGSYNLEASFMAFGVLPLRQLELKGKKEKENHLLSWTIDADEEVVEQTLEVNVSGNEYKPVGLLNASSRSFSYLPRESGMLKYRLHVKFDNGNHYYSNMVALSNESAERPFLNGNFSQNSISITSPSSYDYTITDFSGRMLSKGKLAEGINRINLSFISKGMYLVQFSNGQIQYTDKFIIQ